MQTTAAEQWQRLSAKQGMQGPWVKLARFCELLGLSKNQARRDYLEGPTAWRLGPRKGAKLQSPNAWMQRSGSRGGIAALCVKKDKHNDVFMKYYVAK